jgi:hypothetical protein
MALVSFFCKYFRLCRKCVIVSSCCNSNNDEADIREIVSDALEPREPRRSGSTIQASKESVTRDNPSGSHRILTDTRELYATQATQTEVSETACSLCGR